MQRCHVLISDFEVQGLAEACCFPVLFDLGVQVLLPGSSSGQLALCTESAMNKRVVVMELCPAVLALFDFHAQAPYAQDRGHECLRSEVACEQEELLPVVASNLTNDVLVA